MTFQKFANYSKFQNFVCVKILNFNQQFCEIAMNTSYGYFVIFISPTNYL